MESIGFLTFRSAFCSLKERSHSSQSILGGSLIPPILLCSLECLRSIRVGKVLRPVGLVFEHQSVHTVFDWSQMMNSFSMANDIGSRSQVDGYMLAGELKRAWYTARCEQTPHLVRSRLVAHVIEVNSCHADDDMGGIVMKWEIAERSKSPHREGTMSEWSPRLVNVEEDDREHVSFSNAIDHSVRP